MWQVEAFIKQLPRILPRSSLPDKAQLAVRSSPPSLAPKDASSVGGASGPGGPAAAAGASSGGVKVIAMATLPQQQGGPVPVMILPQGCLSYEREKVPPSSPQQHAAAAPTSVLQKARGNTNKRPQEVVGAGGTVGVSASPASSTPPVKRKRGRPRKPRPEDALPPPAPPPTSQAPIIASVTGGVIQKASSSSSSQPVLVIQDQPGLVLSPLPAVSGPTHRLVEHRGVVVQGQPGGVVEADQHSRRLLLLQGPPTPSWELAAAAGRTPMVEVIQKAPRPSNNNGGGPPHPPAVHLHPPPTASSLPLPTLLEEHGEVEITLTPVELHVSPPPPPPVSASSPVAPPYSSSIIVKEEEEERSCSTSSKMEGQ